MIQESTQLPSTTSTSTLVERGKLFEVLNKQLAINQYHLPDYIFRADLVPLNFVEYPPEQRLNILNGAAIQLSFVHGYPALNETLPFWEQLPSEPHDAYNAFMIYLEFPEKSNHDNPVRMLPMIAEVTKIPLEDIAAYSHIYYWHQRAKAYDLFIVACHRKQREFRIMSIEGAHFKMADEMLAKIQKIASKKLDEAMDEEGDDTKLKDVIDMAHKLVQIQRISVGLAANGNQQIDMGPRHAPASDHMASIAKDETSHVSTSRPIEMDKLLADESDLASIQDLIVRINSPKEPNV